MYISDDLFPFLQPITCNAKLPNILIHPGNVRYLAKFIDSSATIDSRSIRFGSGTANEKLLQVPIAAAGELDAHASIRVTVGLEPPSGDSDPRIAISDGTNQNKFIIPDRNNYGEFGPCIIVGSQVNKLVTTRTPSPQFTFLFSPFYKYGACSSAQDGGYLNVGTFNNQVDPTYGLSFVVYRGDDTSEQYQFRYFLIEIL